MHRPRVEPVDEYEPLLPEQLATRIASAPGIEA